MTNSSKSRSPTSANSALRKAATALTHINKHKASPYYQMQQHQVDNIYLNESSVYTQSMRNQTTT